MTPEQVLEYVQQNNVEYVDLRYTDEEKKTNLDIYYPTSGMKLLANPDAKQDFDDWTPRVGL